ncbi:MAG TPA: cell wall-binding repeat-containing protein [Baekduia sp.]|nr:cell wall-binding repeat-containing protein [Baekduia sp.]
MPRPVRLGAVLLATAAISVGLASCGGDDGPQLGVKGGDKNAPAQMGFPVIATKNPTRIGGGDSIVNAAAAAQAVYTSGTPVTRPAAVVLAPVKDWRIGLAASVLMGPPLRAPLLYTDGDSVPAATKGALDTLKPRGARELRRAQVIRVGNKADTGLKTVDIRGSDPAAVARSIDAFAGAARKNTADRVLVVSSEDPEFAMPAAAWAAKSGDPILFSGRDAAPEDTVRALQSHQRPQIYMLGPESVLSKTVFQQLGKLGKVTRIAGKDPVSNAIAFARFIDGPFGWGIVDPGHGMVIGGLDRPTDAAAVAPLSASGSYGPFLVTDSPKQLPTALRNFLLDIQPGYAIGGDPVRGVYNRAWIIGDEETISREQQSTLDALLEIVPVSQKSSKAAPVQ